MAPKKKVLTLEEKIEVVNMLNRDKILIFDHRNYIVIYLHYINNVFNILLGIHVQFDH